MSQMKSNGCDCVHASCHSTQTFSQTQILTLNSTATHPCRNHSIPHTPTIQNLTCPKIDSRQCLSNSTISICSKKLEWISQACLNGTACSVSKARGATCDWPAMANKSAGFLARPRDSDTEVKFQVNSPYLCASSTKFPQNIYFIN